MILCEDVSEDAVGRTPGHFVLECPVCGFASEDDGLRLNCDRSHGPALLVSKYGADVFCPAFGEDGLYRYRQWLPIRRTLKGSGRTVTYQSESLSKQTGLANLWFAFNGYWPEKGACLPTGTFKDLEAYSVLGRMPLDSGRVLVVASAGNTAAAFARACSLNRVPCLILMPEAGLAQMRFDVPIDSCVKVVSLTGSSDYTDAIRAADRIAQLPGFMLEGGARNIARRDGLGTVLLNAYETIGRLPEFYFQAIGSGTGAIAAHEAARRITAGRGPYPHLRLSQNAPFVPIRDVWRSRSPEWLSLNEKRARREIDQIESKVLCNRCPPYAIRGGLYDALVESEGDVAAVTNEQAALAAELFETSEGIDIEPAAAVAFASVLEAAAGGSIPADATVVVNITGGGKRKLASDTVLIPKLPDVSIDVADAEDGERVSEVLRLFR
jgi:cysteate synthase